MTNLLKQLGIDFRIKIGYGTAFILLLISYSLTWVANKQLVEQSKRVINNNVLINHIEGLVSNIKDAETGLRGFMITHDEDFLHPYTTSWNRVDSFFKLIKKETQDNSSQQIRLYTLKRMIDEKYDIMTFSKDHFTANKNITDSIMQATYQGKYIMDSIRSEIILMKSSEQQLLKERNETLSSRYITMNIIIVTSLVLAFLFVVFGFITYIRENNARKMADKKVQEYHDQLQERIKELDTANKELIEMRRSEKFAATGRIARNIAHEVRNPLTNIDLAIGQLKTEINDPDEGMTMLFDMINRNSKRINQLITELLNATRFAELNYQLRTLNELTEEALDLAQDRLELKGIVIEKNFAEKMCDILVDSEKIKIALLNIIVNAAESIEHDHGVLKINTFSEDNKCVIEISDNGVGMNEEAVGKLFEPYFTTKPKGNGLGLTNTQNIILNHKGTINVESKVGVGTKFILKFENAPGQKN
ncbi:MAG: CHASE3 domain-containing protein [Bacteroidota bacterium]